MIYVVLFLISGALSPIEISLIIRNLLQRYAVLLTQRSALISGLQPAYGLTHYAAISIRHISARAHFSLFCFFLPPRLSPIYSSITAKYARPPRLAMGEAAAVEAGRPYSTFICAARPMPPLASMPRRADAIFLRLHAARLAILCLVARPQWPGMLPSSPRLALAFAVSAPARARRLLRHVCRLLILALSAQGLADRLRGAMMITGLSGQSGDAPEAHQPTFRDIGALRCHRINSAFIGRAALESFCAARRRRKSRDMPNTPPQAVSMPGLRRRRGATTSRRRFHDDARWPAYGASARGATALPR